MSLRIRALDFSPVTERFEGENLTGAPLRKPIEILRPRLSIAPSGTSASRRFSISVENSGRAQFITLSISLMRKGSAASGFTRSISTSILTHILRSSKIKKKKQIQSLAWLDFTNQHSKIPTEQSPLLEAEKIMIYWQVVTQKAIWMLNSKLTPPKLYSPA